MIDGQPYNPYKLFTGIFIPEALVESAQLSLGAKVVFGRLARYAGESGECFPAVETLGRAIGISERQARRYLTELEDFGLIRRKQRGSTSSVYQFLWHPILYGRAGGTDVSGPGGTDVSAEESHIEENHLTHTQAVRVRPPTVSDLDGQTSQRWEDFWGKSLRKQHKDAAARNWISYVTVENEAKVFACLDRYLRSADVARGVIMNPDKWLYEQHLMDWEGDWPAKPKTLDEMIEEMPDV